MRKDKYIRVSTAMGVVLIGGCGKCKLRKSEYCEGCRTQTILDLLDDVAKTGGVEIPQRHGRLIDADALAAKDDADYEDAMECIADVSLRSIVSQIHNWTQKIIAEADTIIPADGGADNG